MTKKPPGIWVGQSLHFVCLLALLGLVWTAWNRLAQPYPFQFWLAVAVPVVHQIFVWLAWRLELRSKATSKAIGFRGYLAVFFLLFGGRFGPLVVLAWLDRGSLALPLWGQVIGTVLLAAPGVYAGYSVQRYFGMARAAGADHFIPSHRELPLVRQGIFRFTNNGMYVYVFLLFWALALGFNSSAALLLAAFSHAYIWVHFYATEQPDMEFLYGEAA